MTEANRWEYLMWVRSNFPMEVAQRINRHNDEMHAVLRSMDLRDMVAEQQGRGEWQDIYYSLARMEARGEIRVPHWYQVPSQS